MGTAHLLHFHTIVSVCWLVCFPRPGALLCFHRLVARSFMHVLTPVTSLGNMDEEEKSLQRRNGMALVRLGSALLTTNANANPTFMRSQLNHFAYLPRRNDRDGPNSAAGAFVCQAIDSRFAAGAVVDGWWSWRAASRQHSASATQPAGLREVALGSMWSADSPQPTPVLATCSWTWAVGRYYNSTHQLAI
eukprot:COSAG01_NODE_20126_length_969_cov_2.352874_1_plen_191_part_00